MAASPKRRRPNGSLPALKRGLWSVFLRNVELVEDEAQPIDIRLRASTAAVQAGLAWGRVVELHDHEARISAIEAADERNGHHGIH
jgi:hypothetical protein